MVLKELPQAGGEWALTDVEDVKAKFKPICVRRESDVLRTSHADASQKFIKRLSRNSTC